MHRALFLILLASLVKAESPDGIHRIDKSPQTTRHRRLHPRDAGHVCGADMKLCPSSIGGNCCPENYECGRESCYATTRGPSTCGTKVGWYACAAVYGGGCCPDGYLCQRAANCVPPSGSSYTFDCPSSQYLCPSSMKYGCCPNGMGCGVDQCYSTTQTPVTRTDQGRVADVTATATTVASPVTPTASSDGGSEHQRVLKYYPAVIPKISSQGGKDTSGSDISRAQLSGIVAGCVSFAVLVLLAVFPLWKRLRSSEMTIVEIPKGSGGVSVDSVVTTSSARRSSGGGRPPSVHVSTELALTELESTEHTPTTPAEPGLVSHAGYPDQTFIQSPATYGEHHGLPASAISPDSSCFYDRQVRPMSDLSDMSSSFDAGSPRRRAPVNVAELEGQHGIAELPDSEASAVVDDWSMSMFGWVTCPPPPAYSPQQRTRIDGWASHVAASRLGVVDEEKHAPL
ncbi:hypothetical protein G6O67_007828 [Ophiocordyceps sinensis]|uniref:Uncharacterized protein n=1 Tax=Ophiocordyceps sinensis TaxID=72228 RepID=A0A8H4PP25_9HYPO|nr:hypothetical protein G6O67_007828 [Ophiocordyceps sinensis]